MRTGPLAPLTAPLLTRVAAARAELRVQGPSREASAAAMPSPHVPRKDLTSLTVTGEMRTHQHRRYGHCFADAPYGFLLFVLALGFSRWVA